jgi:hypothetical protein
MRGDFVSTVLIFTDSDFREIATNAFFLIYQQAWPEMPMFQCAAGFTALFKSRHELTSRKIHFKGRTSVTEEQHQRWLTTAEVLLRTVAWNRIANSEFGPGRVCVSSADQITLFDMISQEVITEQLRVFLRGHTRLCFLLVSHCDDHCDR